MPTRTETSQEYVARILGNLKGQDPMEVLATTAGRLRQYAAQPERVLRERPAPEKWSVVEIMAHLADVEIVGSWRFRLILAHDGTPVQAFDQDEWVTNLRYQETDPAESIELFDAARTANLRLFRRVEPARLENRGVHPERGPESVAHIIRLFAGHDLNHLGQIDDIVRRARST
jgi:hypothetical protein